MNANIDLRRLHHFVLLADELNFSRAAERAHLSQTAFSRSIQSLEDSLGLRLFDRSTRTVHLTPGGAQLLGHARGLLAKSIDLGHEVAHITQVTGGDLVFGATLIMVDSVLCKVVPLLRQQCPGLRLDIKVGQAHALREMLEQERIEMFIGYANELAQEPAFELTPLPAQFGSVYCRSGHPLASPDARPSPAQLLEYPWAAVIASEAMAVRMRTWLGVPADTRLPVSVTCDSLGLLREVVLSSDTLLATWPSWLQPDLESGKVVDLGPLLRPAMPHDLLKLDCAIVRLAGRTASPAAEHLIRLVRATVERGQPT